MSMLYQDENNGIARINEVTVDFPTVRLTPTPRLHARCPKLLRAATIFRHRTVVKQAINADVTDFAAS